MSYKKPVCDCGKELLYEEERLVTGIRYKIGKNGVRYKKPIRGTDGRGVTGEQYYTGLYCPDCDSCYEYIECHKTSRVFRGDKI